VYAVVVVEVDCAELGETVPPFALKVTVRVAVAVVLFFVAVGNVPSVE